MTLWLPSAHLKSKGVEVANKRLGLLSLHTAPLVESRDESLKLELTSVMTSSLDVPDMWMKSMQYGDVSMQSKGRELGDTTHN